MPPDLITQALEALRHKNYAAARTAITAYADTNPLELQHFLIKGLSELALSDSVAALKTFMQATDVFPHQPQVWANLGVTQENLGQLDDAAESLEHALELKADQADICGNLSNIYRKLGRFADAEEMAHRAFELGAPKAQALNSLGLALGKQGEYDAAQTAFKNALKNEPTNADILANLANLNVDQLHFPEAWNYFARARAINDSAIVRRDEGMARLLAGDYEKGWQLYSARLELPNALRLKPTCPLWRGEPLAGKKLLLISEQGFGDTVMFCRYGKAFLALGADIIWTVQKPLQRLLAANLPGTVYAETDALPACDYFLPLLSLPHALGKNLPNEAPVAPYLHAPNEPALPHTKKDLHKIGLVLAGSHTHERDHERSLEIEQLAPIFAKIPVQYYAPSPTNDISGNVTSLADLIHDFADTASLLTQLDCLITVDTSVAHLAGALGVKTYLLLPHCPDWRWGTQGETTTWYTNMTLLRQPHYGDWDSVITQLTEKLA